jgi:DNA-binding CsgD family transcriptional regulator
MKFILTATARVVDLTDRQKEMVMLISEGLSSKEIAHRLGIATKTANFHRYQIRKKLGVPNTVGIVRWAIREKIIQP